MMNELSVLVGGQAGDGIRQAGVIISKLLNSFGYRIFMYYDYPSLIRGGHNFSIVRASKEKIQASRDYVNIILALNQETVDKHRKKLTKDGFIIFDSDTAKAEGIGVPATKIIKEIKGLPIMRGMTLIGALARTIGMDEKYLENVIKRSVPAKIELNIKAAKEGYVRSQNILKLERLDQKPMPLLFGNEALALGAVKAGLDIYIAYPMTPSSSILHYLAAHARDFKIAVVHPENEIAVITMAIGAAYSGARAMVGTSGGGFALMTESLSLAAMSETPIVIVVSQRPGPSTGVPTYTMQGDLHFILNAGHGEFIRFVVAPGDAEEAFYYTAEALNIAWKYQIPSLVLLDKHLSESLYSFDEEIVGKVKVEDPLLWDGKGEYKRYLITESGISPLAFPGIHNAIIKATSYEHDEYGITTEESERIKEMTEKRLRKYNLLKKEVEKMESIKVFDRGSQEAVITWGSTKGVCEEVTGNLGITLVQPIVLEPLPKKIRTVLKDVKKRIIVEVNATGQLRRLLENNGIKIHHTILKYDGRPFEVEELEEKIKGVL